MSRPDNKDWPQQDPHEEDADANHNVGEDNELDSLFDFIDVCVPSKHPIDPGGQGNDGGSGSGSGDRDSGDAGPSTTSIPNSRRTALSLDDNDDERVVDEDEEAGVITDIDSHMHNKWLEGREEAPSGEEYSHRSAQDYNLEQQKKRAQRTNQRMHGSRLSQRWTGSLPHGQSKKDSPWGPSTRH